MNQKITVAGVVAALTWVAAADTWYLQANNSAGVKALNNLSYWTNSVGTVGSDAPTSADCQVVPAGRTLRSGDVTSKAQSVTIYGQFTHDGPGTTTWANDGIIIGPDAIYSLNTFITGHPFDDMRTITIAGKVTAIGDDSHRSFFTFAQVGYSNHFYKVAKLIGAEGSAIRSYSSTAVNNTLWIEDASAFKGSARCAYNSDGTANARPLKDNGEYGGRTGFKGLDTPGSIYIGRNWVLGAEPGVVTKAASVELVSTSRVEVALAEGVASRLEVSTSFTMGKGVQIFVLGNGDVMQPGRYPVLTAPVELDLSAFVLKKSPGYATMLAELETEYADNVGTLYLRIDGYCSLYVDAENGDDAWDGSTNAIPSAATIEAGGVIPGPKKTLAGAMAVACAGSTVYAAEGVYDEGEMFAGEVTSNRVVVSANVTIEATGERSRTVIKGKISTEEGNWNGCGADAMRCVCLKSGAVVKGFTLEGGRTSGTATDTAVGNGGAVWGPERGLLCDCVVTNCGSRKRGGNAFGKVTMLRCREYTPACQAESLDNYVGVRAIDSIFHYIGGSSYRDCQFVNCTFTANHTTYGNGASEMCILRNCLHLYASANNNYQGRNTATYNSYFRSTTNSTAAGVSYDERCRFKLTAEDLPHSATSYRPLAGSVVIGQGDLAMYLAATNGWTVTMRRQFTMKDMYGTDRLYGGALDIGAVQHCDYHRYVNAVNGDDANDGLTAATAKRTLKAAMEAWTAEGNYEDGILHAAPGIYEEGEMFYANCSNRVVMPATMGLMADGGPGVTTIRGRFGDLANDSKAGAAAVRCVYLNKGAWVYGFKITGGSTQKSSKGDYGLHGGGVYSDGGAAVACEITGNAGGGEDTTFFRGPGGFGGTYIGCYVHDNIGRFQLYHTSSGQYVVNSVMKGTSGYYGQANLLNCTMDTSPDAMAWQPTDTCAWNCHLSTAGRGRCYTNCFFSTASFNVIIHSTTGLPSNSYDPETCRFGVPADFDDNFRPLAGSAPIDAGANYYDERFPAKWARFKDVGFLGQQRVYNGAIDVGAGEYDVRGDFAKALNDCGKVQVNEVSADATLAAGGVQLAAGDAIEMVFVFKATGPAVFTVSGDAAVTVDGVPFAPVGGVYTVNGARGVNRVVKVVNTGSTAATVGTCILPLDGVRVIFR